VVAEPPFPAYTSRRQPREDETVEIRLEDHYWSDSDAPSSSSGAIGDRRRSVRLSRQRRDEFSVERHAQLDYLQANVREAVIGRSSSGRRFR